MCYKVAAESGFVPKLKYFQTVVGITSPFKDVKMLVRIVICLSWVVAMFVMPPATSALTYTDLMGDKDGLGIGVKENEHFNWWALPPRNGDDVTDFFTYRSVLPLKWSHTFDANRITAIESVTIELFAGALGSYGRSGLFLDQHLVGYFSDGDVDGKNYARVDRFDLTPFLKLLHDGQAHFSVISNVSENGWVDNWALDYSELTITGSSSVPVPEPATMLLLGSGLVGAVGWRRVKRGSRSGS